MRGIRPSSIPIGSDHQILAATSLRRLAATVVAAVLSLASQVWAAPITIMPPATVLINEAETTITIVGLGVADTVHIVARLEQIVEPFDGPDDEEALTISSSGGFGAFMTEMEVLPRTFNFVATVPGETVTILLNTGGEETTSATITIDVNQRQYLTSAQKGDVLDGLLLTTPVVGRAVTAAALCERVIIPSGASRLLPTSRRCTLDGLGLASAFMLQGWTSIHNVVLDPPDPEFTEIARPVPPAFPPRSPDPEITEAEVERANALLANQAEVIGLANVVVTSIDRAQAAFQAGDTRWERRQIEAASRYALKLSQLLSAQGRLRSNVKTALDAVAAAGFPPITVLPEDVSLLQDSLLSGMPLFLVEHMRTLGADDETIELMRRLLLVQDPEAVAGSFPAALTDPALDAGLGRVADRLIDFALENAEPLMVGEEAAGRGVVSGNGGRVRLAFEAKVERGKNRRMALNGAFSLEDRASGISIRQRDSRLTRATIIDDVVVLEGTYVAGDGSAGTFRVVATDNREGRSRREDEWRDHDERGDETARDTVSVSLSNGYRLSDRLRGEIRIENGCGRRSEESERLSGIRRCDR